VEVSTHEASWLTEPGSQPPRGLDASGRLMDGAIQLALSASGRAWRIAAANRRERIEERRSTLNEFAHRGTAALHLFESARGSPGSGAQIIQPSAEEVDVSLVRFYRVPRDTP
jgi:hypothetical protein